MYKSIFVTKCSGLMQAEAPCMQCLVFFQTLFLIGRIREKRILEVCCPKMPVLLLFFYAKVIALVSKL